MRIAIDSVFFCQILSYMNNEEQIAFTYKGRDVEIVFGKNAGKDVWIIKGQRLVVFSTKELAINYAMQLIDDE